MIVLLDPAVLLDAPGDDPLAPDVERRLAERIDECVRICRHHKARIPADGRYWRTLQREIVTPLLARARDGILKRALDGLGQYARPIGTVSPGRIGTSFGFQQVFSRGVFASRPQWLALMEEAAHRAMLTGDGAVIYTWLDPSRHVVGHPLPGGNGSTLLERERWRVHLTPDGGGSWRIPLVVSRRNIEHPWTTRYHHALPVAEDGGRFPFCPHPDWETRATVVVETVASKPSYLDVRRTGWVNPTTGGYVHWDVHPPEAVQQAYGVPHHFNVIAFPSRRAGRVPGDIDHGPAVSGSWTCP